MTEPEHRAPPLAVKRVSAFYAVMGAYLIGRAVVWWLDHDGEIGNWQQGVCCWAIAWGLLRGYKLAGVAAGGIALLLAVLGGFAALFLFGLGLASLVGALAPPFRNSQVLAVGFFFVIQAPAWTWVLRQSMRDEFAAFCDGATKPRPKTQFGIRAVMLLTLGFALGLATRGWHL